MPLILFNSGLIIATETAPVSGADGVDLSPVCITWQSTNPGLAPLDLSGFSLQKLSPYAETPAVPLSITALGGGEYLVCGDVGLYPDEVATVSAIARTVIGGYREIRLILSTRVGMSSLDGDLSEIGERGPGSVGALADLPQAIEKGGEAQGQIQISGSFFDTGLSEFLLTDLLMSLNSWASVVYMFPGSEGVHASLYPLVGYFGGEGLINEIVGAPAMYDIGLGRLTRIEPMDPQTHPLSLETGLPENPVAAMISAEIKGLSRVETFILSALLSGLIRQNLQGGGSLVIASGVTSEEPGALSLETGKPIDGSYPVSIETMSGEGLLIFLDLLSAILAKLRE